MKKLFFVLMAFIIFAGCTIDSGESEITCGITWDPGLLDNPPGDSVYVVITSNDLPELNRSWIGLIDEELSDSLDAVAYTNLEIKIRNQNNVAQLTGIGTQVNDTTDQTYFRMSFDFIEQNAIEQACRFNKTIREEHRYSNWFNGNEGVRLDLEILDSDGERLGFTTGVGDNDGNNLVITGVKILDDAAFFGMLKGSFQASLIQTDAPDSDPVIVNGEFQYVVQISNGITPF